MQLNNALSNKAVVPRSAIGAPTGWDYITDTKVYGGGYYRARSSATQPASFGTSPLPDTDSKRTYIVLVTWAQSAQNRNDAVFDTIVGGSFEGSTVVNQQIAPADYQDASGRWWHILDSVIREPAGTATTIELLAATGAQADAVKILEVGPATSTFYDAVGNAVYLVDPVNNATTFAYDGLNRVTSETNILGKTRSFAYDSLSRLTKETLRHTSVTKTIEHVFDNLGRQTQEIWKDNTTTIRTIDFGWDLLSRLTSVSDSATDARDYVFEHDNLGRNTKTSFHVVNSWGDRHWQFNNTFDSLHRQTLRVTKLSVNGYAFGTVTNDQTDYDNLSRVTLMKQWNTTGVAPKRAEFKYKADGQYDEIKRFNATTGGTAFVTSSYGYDNAGRLTTLDHKNSAGTSITGYAMAYDPANRITSVDFTNSAYAAEDVTYAYDRTDQLTTADRSATDENYAYDEAGNRARSGWVTGTNNQLTEDPTFTYTYDAEGNRTSRVRKSSASADDKTIEYTWDHKNRLTKVTFKRNDGTVTKTIDYIYDAFDRLTRRTMDPDGALGSASLISNEYLWDGEQLIYMDWIGVSGESRYYMYGPAGEVLFEEVAGDSVLYAVLTDHLGTYRDLVNTSGTTINHIVYDAYGKILSETTATPNSPRVRFTGQLFDYQAGLNYHHHRWYDTSAGRWISEDPIGFRGRDPNLNRYANNSPPNYVDPDGQLTWALAQVFRVRRFIAQLFPPPPAPFTPPATPSPWEAFWGSIGDSLESMGLAAQGEWEEAYERGPLGQTANDDGFAYYGTRGALTISTLAMAAVVGRGGIAAIRGEEMMVTSTGTARIAFFGNRTGHSIGRWPHYHRRVPDPTRPGQSLPGQGIGRHRPWESKSTDGSIWHHF
jgi:RHS repeat-associated protein